MAAGAGFAAAECLESSSSAALARAAELTDPVMSRASSATRSTWVSRSTAVLVLPSLTRFETPKWAVA
jgi:hypothetical protein